MLNDNAMYHSYPAKRVISDGKKAKSPSPNLPTTLTKAGTRQAINDARDITVKGGNRCYPLFGVLIIRQ